MEKKIDTNQIDLRSAISRALNDFPEVDEDIIDAIAREVQEEIDQNCEELEEPEEAPDLEEMIDQEIKYNKVIVPAEHKRLAAKLATRNLRDSMKVERFLDNIDAYYNR